MAKPIADGVVEAVRYGPDMNISLVRVYLRRGPTYSDFILLTRQALIEQMQNGKQFYSGTRKPYLASTFFINQKFNLREQDGSMFITVKDSNSRHDDSDLAPLF